MAVGSRLKHAWNAFLNIDDPGRSPLENNFSYSSGTQPHRARMSISSERSIVSSIYTRLSIDVAGIDIRHVRLDDSGRYLEDIDSGLNSCLTLEANIDQAARAFRQDIATTLFDRGVAVIVPVHTDVKPTDEGGFNIRSLRVGHVVSWGPRDVRVSLYNEDTGRREEVTLSKKTVAIVENPLYAVMNEPNSTLQRLIRKVNLLDGVDEQSSSGKLDMIIQLPYVIKSEARRQQAEQRRKEIEFQLTGSKYGIAYTDGTEKITQLNRPVENNLLQQVETLTNQLYTQLGLTPEVMNGTANEEAMLNYANRTLDPVVGAITEAMLRTFLTKTARTQKQSILYFRDPFKLVPVGKIAEIGDKFTRNEILTSNEIRQILGFRPAADPKADELRNSNMPAEKVEGAVPESPVDAAPAEAASPEDEEELSTIEDELAELMEEVESEQDS